MAIRTSTLPFSIILEQPDRRQAVVNMCWTEDEMDEKAYIELRENMDTAVLFEGEESCRLYIEGMEHSLSQALREEKGETFLTPSSEHITLFRHNDFPLIPGDYLIKAVCDGLSYYAMLRIQPKQMTSNQLGTMRDEIESFVNGLAQEMVYKQHNSEKKWGVNISPPELAVYTAVLDHYKSVLSALIDLSANVNCRIQTEYELLPVERAARTDEAATRRQLRRPEYRMVQTPVHVCDYNVAENRWLKRMVLWLQKQMKDVYERASQHYEFLQTEGGKRDTAARFLDIADKARRLQNACQRMKAAPWFAEVEDGNERHIPHVVHHDVRYRALFQMNRAWNAIQAEPKASYALRWKRTDKLYEIWGFLQFLQLFMDELSFTPVSGWIFSPGIGTIERVPALSDNTKIVLRQDDITVHLIYEGELPLDGEETAEQDNPLYTEAVNNKPDLRIDLFQHHTYMGSLVIDFKYRPLHHIWDVTRVKQKTKTMHKLVHYGVSCKSRFLFGTKAAKYVRPVHEVWAVHPNVYAGYPPSLLYENHDLRIVQLSPNHSMKHVTEDVRQVLQDMLEKKKRLAAL